jgi:hypothetical protein
MSHWIDLTKDRSLFSINNMYAPKIFGLQQVKGNKTMPESVVTEAYNDFAMAVAGGDATDETDSDAPGGKEEEEASINRRTVAESKKLDTLYANKWLVYWRVKLTTCILQPSHSFCAVAIYELVSSSLSLETGFPGISVCSVLPL